MNFQTSSELFILPSCPLLPEVKEPVLPSGTRAYAERKDGEFYLAALRYAQSLWRQGKPAQAILQLNKALMADLNPSLDAQLLQEWPAPYQALIWFLLHRPEDRFIGNPVRHFQHLATRVSGERKELRSWRAWACYEISRRTLPGEEFPRDEEQIEKERLVFPSWEEILAAIESLGWPGEKELLDQLR